MAVVAGDLKDYLRERIEHLRTLRQTRAVKHEIRMAASAFVHVTGLYRKKTPRRRGLKLVKKKRVA